MAAGSIIIPSAWQTTHLPMSVQFRVAMLTLEGSIKGTRKSNTWMIQEISTYSQKRHEYSSTSLACPSSHNFFFSLSITFLIPRVEKFLNRLSTSVLGRAECPLHSPVRAECPLRLWMSPRVPASWFWFHSFRRKGRIQFGGKKCQWNYHMTWFSYNNSEPPKANSGI